MPSSIPTSAPSTLPSSTPSLEPSAMPSQVPSSLPSSSPSLTPSSEPSYLPSVSMLPTPFSVEVDANIELSFPSIEQTMDDSNLNIFEKETVSFLSENVKYPGFTVTVESVFVVSQELVRPRNPDSESNNDTGVSLFPNDDGNSIRFLQQNSSSLLRLMIEVNGRVNPHNPPGNFSFASTLADTFVENTVSYNNALSKASTFFASLGDASDSQLIGVENKTTFITIVSAGAAGVSTLLLGIAFFIRRKKIANRKKSNSPIKEIAVKVSHANNCLDSPERSPERKYTPQKLTFSKPTSGEQSSPETSESGDSPQQIALTESNLQNMSSGEFLDYVAIALSPEEKKSYPDLSANNSLAKKSLASYYASVASKSEVGRSSTDSSESETDMPPRPERQRSGSRGKNQTSPHSPMKANGRVYDFYAPPGPLGIVIESTSEGPMVHSMSHSSPLLGIVDRGDYIIGLDDVDTKGMNAAQLTRLMAKRSQQPQRKISLLSCGSATKY